VITRQLQASEVLSKLSTMNGKSSFLKVPVVITTSSLSYTLTILQEHQLCSGILWGNSKRFVVITRQLQASEVLSKLSTMNGKSSFLKVPVVITKQRQAAKCSLSCQLLGRIFTLLKNLQFPYCCTRKTNVC
jgi:hypothetical protein